MPELPLFRSPATSDGQAPASPRFGGEDAFGPGDYGSDDGDTTGVISHHSSFVCLLI